jgi:hypothetical protein
MWSPWVMLVQIHTDASQRGRSTLVTIDMSL